MKKWLVLIALVLCTVSFAAAQDGTEDFTNTVDVYGFLFDYPDGVEVFTYEDGAYYFETDVVAIDFDFYVDRITGDEGSSKDAILAFAEEVFGAFDPDVSFVADESVFTVLGGYSVLRYDFTDANNDGSTFPTTYVVFNIDTTWLIGYIYPLRGSVPATDEEVELAVQILGTYRPSLSFDLETFTNTVDVHGYSFSYPDEVTSLVDDDGVFYFETETTVIDFDFFVDVITSDEVSDEDYLEFAAEVFFPFDSNLSFDPDMAYFNRVAGYNVMYYSYTDTNASGNSFPTTYVMFYIDTTWLVGYVYPITGSTAPTDEEAALAVFILSTYTPEE